MCPVFTYSRLTVSQKAKVKGKILYWKFPTNERKGQAQGRLAGGLETLLKVTGSAYDRICSWRFASRYGHIIYNPYIQYVSILICLNGSCSAGMWPPAARHLCSWAHFKPISWHVTNQESDIMTMLIGYGTEKTFCESPHFKCTSCIPIRLLVLCSKVYR